MEQPMFTPISHPQLKQLSQTNINIFLREWDRCILRIKDANHSDGSPSPTSLKATPNVDLLHSLIDLEEFGVDVNTLDDFTSEQLTLWLKKKEGNILRSISLEQLGASVKTSIWLNLSKSDPQLRAILLFADYQTLL